jgi:ribonuclease BN (tRNA processing enzyme)
VLLVVRVTVLGSGDAFGSGGRLHSAYLVESSRRTFLVDCGPSVLQALKRVERDPGALDFILLSHLHGDHFGGVPFLFMEYLYEQPRTRPLVVCGPPGTEHRVRALFAALYEKTAAQPLPFAVHYREMHAGQACSMDGIDILPLAVPHAPELTAFAFRIAVDGRTILYSGDSSWTDEFIVQSRGTDLFLCECSYFARQPNGIHVSWEEIAAHLPQLGSRRLVLSHLGRVALGRCGEISVECARDGLTLDL